MNEKSEKKMTLIVGPCVIEDEGFVLELASELKRQLKHLPVEFYFKASFDKANRTSGDAFRGPGLKAGLKILGRVQSQLGLQVLTDLHGLEQVLPVAEQIDFIQLPAFLCRQTDLILATAKAALHFGRRLNIKKGQFLAPWDAKNIVNKVRTVQAQSERQASREDWFCLTERGVSFGYNALIVDMTSFQTMQAFGVPVIYDATHSVQMPGAAQAGSATGGRRQNIECLARAALAAGADGVFLECHPHPEHAKSDGPNAFYLDRVGAFVEQLLQVRACVKQLPKLL